MSEAGGTRGHEHEIEIPVPIDHIWKAISEGEELTRWYVESAEVLPGEGGTVKISFGPGMDGSSRIEIWEPGRRLRLAQMRPEEEAPPMPGGPDISKLAAPIIEEFVIETRDGKTYLRLINSGIPDSEDWDGFYDGTKHGWGLFLLQLRHYLVRHYGKPRRSFAIMHPIQVPADEAHATILGAKGLTASGELGKPESTFELTTAAGEELQGKILLRTDPKILLLEVDNWDGSLLSFAFQQFGPQSFLYISVSVFGWTEDRFSATQARWHEWIGQLFPAPKAS